MSDLSITLEALERARSQLSVSTYFDEDLFRREQELIFQHGPRYLAHELAIPEVGDYYALPQEGEGRVLVRAPDGGVELLSNVCRHRQAVMLKGRGQTASNIVCPLHRWTYGLDGKLLGAPHFAQDPCLHLNRYATRGWNGLVFEDNGRDVAADLAGLGPRAQLDFTGYVLDKVHVHECDYNWKTFIEVYLEDYHVGPFHPGLGSFVTCDDLEWEFGADYSVQTVGVANGLGIQTMPRFLINDNTMRELIGVNTNMSVSTTIMGTDFQTSGIWIGPQWTPELNTANNAIARISPGNASIASMTR